MKTISGKQLKEEWKKFWESRQHVWLPEAPLIGGKESTAMFNIAGMQQLIPYLSGQAHPLGKRLFNIQKCIRTVDIDEVGDASHCTFFEMMGNRSLGDYFKKEAVQRSWEFLTEVLGFEQEKLAATVFEGDKEVAEDTETIGYRKNAGLDEQRICTMTAKDNRRSPGPVGPCGPCTEIYYWVGTTKLPPKGSTPKTDEANWLEVRNNVFMEYYRDESGKLTKLKNRNVDTGMGFERMCKVLQQKESAYETDVFASLLAIITDYVGLPYAGNERRYRIIADHLRTSFFMMRDGIAPSNEGRGYVLRRLIRRMYYNMMLLKEVDSKTLPAFLKNIVKELTVLFDLTGNFDQVIALLEKEVTQFQKTISNGQKLLQDIIKSSKKKTISGADAFKLYDTFGFPVELTKEIAMEVKCTVDEIGFAKEMGAQQQRSRAGSKNMFTQDVDRSKYIIDLPATKFVGYDTMKADKTKLLKDFEVGGQRILVFDQTPFYAESGGQISDSGIVVLDSGDQLHIKEVKKYEGVFLHFVQ
ncbi:MAG: alanine--tRNA ligase [candidate division SR1 bacterium]|nr:alanine--tRNA ligase [candidate division SR1 bacterium]